jgi:GTP-binding protein EngB required for normal cell division
MMQSSASIAALVWLTSCFANSGVRYVVIGNGGVGKSCILNGILDQTLFESGLSGGAGLTQKVQTVQFGPDLFMDSPGLADISIREQAADEIESALKHGGLYKPIFVLTVEACLKGRCKVRPEDRTTIELVLKAAPDITDYGVIINKLEAHSMKLLQNKTDPTYAQLLASLMHGLPEKSLWIYLNLRSQDLVSATNALMPHDMRTGIINFLYRVPAIEIHPERVSAIESLSENGFREKRDSVGKNMDKVRRDPKAIDDELKDIEQEKLAKAEEQENYAVANINDPEAGIVGGILEFLKKTNEIMPLCLDTFKYAFQLSSVVLCLSGTNLDNCPVMFSTLGLNPQ